MWFVTLIISASEMEKLYSLYIIYLFYILATSTRERKHCNNFRLFVATIKIVID